ncbi:MAG: hypothetical protein RMN24_10055 [Anaerolineae bacterium]|nr:hypothetical protein [Anaerolineae bacterium]
MIVHNLRLQPLDLTRGGDRAAVTGLLFRLYRDDPYWLAPPPRAYRRQLDPRRAGLGLETAVAGFLAEGFLRQARSTPNGLPVVVSSELTLGAIGLMLTPPGRVARFFALEFYNDRVVCARLLEAAWEWAGERGARALQGPIAPFGYGDDGLLADGFDQAPVLLAPYHLPYYAELVEGAGLDVVAEMAMVRLPCTGVEHRPTAPAVRSLPVPPWELLAAGGWRFLAGVQALARPPFAPGLMSTCTRLHRSDLAWGWYEEDHALQPEGLIWLLPDQQADGRYLRRLCGHLSRPRPSRRTRLAALALRRTCRREDIGPLLLATALQAAAVAGFTALEFGLYPVDDPTVTALLASHSVMAPRRYRLYERRE